MYCPEISVSSGFRLGSSYLMCFSHALAFTWQLPTTHWKSVSWLRGCLLCCDGRVLAATLRWVSRTQNGGALPPGRPELTSSGGSPVGDRVPSLHGARPALFSSRIRGCLLGCRTKSMWALGLDGEDFPISYPSAADGGAAWLQPQRPGLLSPRAPHVVSLLCP